MRSKKCKGWLKIVLSPSGPIIVVGQWETIIYCWEILVSLYRCPCRALRTCGLYEPKEVSPCLSSVKLHPKSTVMANLLLPLGIHKTATQEMHRDKAIQRTHRQFQWGRGTHTRRNPRERKRERNAREREGKRWLQWRCCPATYVPPLCPPGLQLQ
jgi:hypothetical protein